MGFFGEDAGTEKGNVDWRHGDVVVVRRMDQVEARLFRWAQEKPYNDI